MMMSESLRMTSPICIISTVISLLALVSVTLGASEQSEVAPHRRQKRHILQMCELIAVHTNRGCLDYNNYGCFCGLGNAASHHVDAVDGCCRVHDRCYGDVACFWIYPQFVGYSVDCSGDECVCTDSALFSPCAYTTCQCDLQFAQCLGRANYNRRFSNFDRKECNRPRRGRRQEERKRKRRMAKAKKQARELTRRRDRRQSKQRKKHV